MATIRFLSAGDTDGCSFYRCQEPARVLRLLGHDATSSRTIGLADALTADVIVFQRSSELPALELMETLLKRSQRPKIVYEIDDDLLNVPEHFGSVFAGYQDHDRRHRIRLMINQADAVTTPSSHLAGAVMAYRSSVAAEPIVVPNYVPERFVVDAVPELDTEPIIGWAGSASHVQDFEQLVIPLRKVLRETQAGIHTIGADYTHRLRAAARVRRWSPGDTWVDAVTEAQARVRHTPWVDGVDGYMAELDFTIGLAPLVDDVFNRSKSDIKIKEYAARGIAPIVSHVGPYAASPGLFTTARLDSVPRWFADIFGWTATITDLLEQPTFLRKMQTLALEWARENTLERHAGLWEKALLS